MDDSISPNIRLVLDILRDEVEGNVANARAKMSDNFSVTYMYKDKDGNLFPSINKPSALKIADVYKIKNRSYEIYNYAENHFDDHDVVFIEMIERYTDPNNGQHYQTPIVVVLELEGEKIKTNRHYCDNDISYADISSSELNRAYQGKHGRLVID